MRGAWVYVFLAVSLLFISIGVGMTMVTGNTTWLLLLFPIVLFMS